ncbi:alcohol dehydrogenase [Marchantia polymorpha subsp. ruderalis]|uniref:Alcohol dehydrogenase 4 n=2 Tax=Marchantia polymorpha TaxID=3197 RepID=A0AAF6BAU6_MARPO|nr:hypothetical protein MARPO_0041s0020 [Marchantia polymorpha]BBN09130.1 hypothetical protein Mp_4g17380 [Marchantia polymorpha subsp. ruderalis]|eukprot:PTQ40118.1 hypothetical protein MARPO_0041s0020 [Marchantia polymorpha]
MAACMPLACSVPSVRVGALSQVIPNGPSEVRIPSGASKFAQLVDCSGRGRKSHRTVTSYSSIGMRISATLAQESQQTELQREVLHDSLTSTLMDDPTQASHGVNYHHPDAGTNGYAFFMPTLNLIGVGALNGAGAQIAELGFKKALIVTDKVLVKVGAVNAIIKVLDEINVKYSIYDGTEPNPTDKQVDEGVAMLKKEECDFIVSFGGGSPHDCAKAIGVLATNGGRIHDYEGLNKTKNAMLPLVAVNTTAGTAAELTRFAIITDTKRHVKMAIIDWKVTPTIAVDDPTLMVGMPKSLTAATGMDALTHAIEAYVSTISNPVTDASALHAMKLIKTYLRDAVTDGKNLKARDMMSYAEFLAGMAFNSASLGYVHAMAHQLGGMYNLPHGVCNAVLLPVVQEFNAKKVPILFIDIAEAFGYRDIGENADLAVKVVLEEIRSLSKDVGIPKNLAELGVKPEDFEELAENAMKDACGFTNPRAPTKQEVVELFRLAHEQ